MNGRGPTTQPDVYGDENDHLMVINHWNICPGSPSSKFHRFLLTPVSRVCPRKLQHTPRAHPRQSPGNANYERNPGLYTVGIGWFRVCPSSVCWFTTLEFVHPSYPFISRVKITPIFPLVVGFPSWNFSHSSKYPPEPSRKRCLFFWYMSGLKYYPIYVVIISETMK